MGARMLQAAISGMERDQDRKEHKRTGVGKMYKYERVPSDHTEEEEERSDPELEVDIEKDAFQQKNWNLEAHLRSFLKNNRGRVVTMAVGVVGVLLLLYWAMM